MRIRLTFPDGTGFHSEYSSLDNNKIQFNKIAIYLVKKTNRLFPNCGLHTIKTLEKTRGLGLIGISLLYFLSSDFNNATLSLILQNFK